MNKVVKLRGVIKTYKLGETEVKAVNNINLEIKKGEFVAIIGPSGSGKSTIMHIIGLLDKPTSGQVYLEDLETSKLTEIDLAKLRNRHIGFVFQSFNLLSKTSALLNVELPLIYSEVDALERTNLAKKALSAVGLSERMDHTPSQLSGGQQQRVAIARALVTNPSLILADEPTGNLDSTSGSEIMSLLKSLNMKGKTIVLVTHDPSVAKNASRIVEVKDGKVIKDRKR